MVRAARSARHARSVLITGHWSALGLKVLPNLLAIDSGCLWGGPLTAIRLEDRAIFQVPCAREEIPSLVAMASCAACETSRRACPSVAMAGAGRRRAVSERQESIAERHSPIVVSPAKDSQAAFAACVVVGRAPAE